MFKKYIVAGSYKEYLNWLRDYKKNPKDYKYITKEEDIVDINNPNLIIFISGYYLNPLFEKRIPIIEKAKRFESFGIKTNTIRRLLQKERK